MGLGLILNLMKSRAAWGLFGGVALCGIIYLGHQHYTGLLAELEQQRVQLAVQGSTIDEQAQALQRWRDEAQAQAARLQEQRRVAERAQAEARRLDGIFAEHDLTRLTLAKPGLVETRVNRGTADVGRVLECASQGGCNNEQ